ncbi:hypothetical protein ACHAPE_007793 [Trichoderma viride]
MQYKYFGENTVQMNKCVLNAVHAAMTNATLIAAKTVNITHEGEDPDGDDVEAADAVVGAGEVDGGDCVGAAGGEEGCVLEEDGGGGDLGDGEGGALEGMEDEGGEEEEGDVCGAGLGHCEEGDEVVR